MLRWLPVLLLMCPAVATSAGLVTGKVLNAETDEPLPAANIRVSPSLGTTSDGSGRFRLLTGPGTHTFHVSMVGHTTVERQIRIPTAGLSDVIFHLKPSPLPMPETIVEGQRPILPHFTDVTAPAGILFEHVYGEGHLRNIREATGAGACFFDHDSDGDADLYLVNGARANALYGNHGDGTFIDLSSSAGVADTAYGMGCAAADYDNDGDVDLYVTNHGVNVLYRNDGDGSFADVGQQAGVADTRWGVGAAWADYDNDGLVDLYVANYLDYDPTKQALRSLVSLHEGFRAYPGPRDYEGQADALFANNGDGSFTDVSAEAGINSPQIAKGMGCVFGDYDGDGDMDLFVANDRTPNQLYRNDDGVFADVALWAGVAFDEAGHESGAMGVDFGDYDGDGLLDLFVTNFDFEYNALYRNAGDGSFLDVTAEAGLAQPGYRFVGWGTGFFDYDNDGHLDIFVANGHVHEDMDVLSENVTFAQPNQLFHNETDGTFTEVSATSGPHFIEPRVSRGVAFADYDNDGDTDLVVLNTGGPVNLLRNDGGSRENWLALRLVGSSANRDAIGARVQVRTGSLNIVREVHAGSSYLSQNELELMFGLGGHSRVEHIHIRWPSGRTATIEDTPINRLMIIAEGREDEGSAGAIGVAD